MAVFMLLASCGGTFVDPDGGREDASDASKADAGWTACSSPDGQRICGGPAACPDDPPNTPVRERTCVCSNVDPSPCILSPGAQARLCGMGAPDGHVCIAPRIPQYVNDFDVTAPFNMGVLMKNAGAGERVRYADFSLFDGTPLPEVATCPKLAFGRVCGGSCGGCSSSEECHGRSPLHPYGICFPKPTFCYPTDRTSCQPNEGCFIYRIQPSVQSYADATGRCTPLAKCQELATTLYPGGADCVPP